MNKIRFTLKAFAFLAFTFAFATAAQAQATRTWVSGVGDDVNPCSRTAPCKTFAGAISKTAAGGEIDALDPGGFGAITITKSITLDGGTGSGWASILASGTTGVNVNDSATATPNTIIVTLRRLSINGAGTTLGTNGINFISGKRVNVEDCQIQNFSTNGIRVAFTAASVSNRLFVSDTSIWNCGDGINVSSTGAGSFATADLKNVKIQKSLTTGDGIELGTNGFASLYECHLAGLDGAAIRTTAGAGGVTIQNSMIINNTAGIIHGAGTSRIGGSSFILNVTGISFTGGTVRSFGDNNFDGNPTPFSGGALTPIAPAKQ
jgi:hypothetical protein